MTPPAALKSSPDQLPDTAPFKVAIIGAGSVGFTKTLISDLLKVPEFAAVEFALTDINQHNLDMIRQIIDTDPNFIFAKDYEGRFTLVNRAVADCYGTSVEHLLGRTDADFNTKSPRLTECSNTWRRTYSRYVSPDTASTTSASTM